MKYYMPAFALASALLMTGCATTSPWDGVPYQERQEWRTIGMEPYAAKQLRSSGFAPEDVRAWVQYGINSPQVIISWYRAGFSAEQTSKWLAKGLTLREAIELTS
ncbi:hypothetical protein [Pseudidiomarina insulisalsae]|uniref:Lipoprotein n=1 Tax=Pseudidiomarina insulisalsae TaxID=575789 RepID=A0A432YMT3_9GAMM|nr:hypothetical protein [Pseudidiomarina insulisalsae]RUO62218.1 hypothetical protein CWI71_05040 [Pseudidiomarina insulisalsae]